MGQCVAKLLENSKEVDGWEGFYVTPEGKLYKLQEVKLSKHSNGYLVAKAMICGIVLREYIHRLVAKAFLENPFGLETVDHINGDKTDNRASNLRWFSLGDNIRHSRRGDYKIKSPSGEVHPFTNLNKFSRKMGLDSSTLSKVLRGKLKHTKGWTACPKEE